MSTGYDQADFALIPLLDGQYAVAQVLEVDGPVPFCALTGRRQSPDAQPAPLALSEIVAFVRTEPTALSAGLWPLAGFDQIPRFYHLYDYPVARVLGFPDTPVHDPAVIEAFLNAWHGLYPWDSFGDLFDTIKRPDLDRPATAT